MASSKLAVSLAESCERYAVHRELRAASEGMYSELTKGDERFIRDWVGAEIHATDGRWSRYKGTALVEKLTESWDKVFRKAPKFDRAHTLYRAVSGEHAAKMAALKVGNLTVDLDRYSSFTHSPEMVRRYALFLTEDAPITIMCVRVRKGTPFVFLGGRKSKNGFSAFQSGREDTEDIDKTQGEVILGPLALRKSSKNTRATLCDGFHTGARNHNVTLVSLQHHVPYGPRRK
jgi:hypothetical protein